MVLSALRRPIFSATKNHLHKISVQYCSTMANMKYETLAVSIPKEFVYLVELNRPEKRNSINITMWQEFKQCFNTLAVESACRAIVLAGKGNLFCAGIDLQSMVSLGQNLADHEDVARKCKVLAAKIKEYQEAFTSLEKCPKPIIAAVHGACVGAGVDMVTAADMRYSTTDAWFQIKETDIGMAADVGTLQRLPKVIGSDSLARELVYTARKFTANEALHSGFVSNLFDDRTSLLAKSIEVAENIAKKSPVAVQTSKLSLIFSRDHSVQEGLDHIAMQNQVMLQSEDFINAVMAQVTKDDSPVFSKL